MKKLLASKVNTLISSWTTCIHLVCLNLKMMNWKKLDYVDTKLVEYHDYVACIIENTLCLTGRAYGAALVDYEAWFCYKTFEGHEPTKNVHWKLSFKVELVWLSLKFVVYCLP